MRDLIKSNILNSKWGSAEQHYMMLFGPQLLEVRAKQAAEAAVEAIQKNNGSYVPGASRSNAPPPPSVDFSNMTPEQRREHGMKRAREIFSGG